MRLNTYEYLRPRHHRVKLVNETFNRSVIHHVVIPIYLGIHGFSRLSKVDLYIQDTQSRPLRNVVSQDAHPIP